MSPGRTPRGRFAPGASGNAGGRPKGSKTTAFCVRELVGEVITEPRSLEAAKQSLRKVLASPRLVINGLTFAARVNREIGAQDGMPAGTIIVFNSNVDVFALRGDRPAPVPVSESVSAPLVRR